MVAIDKYAAELKENSNSNKIATYSGNIYFVVVETDELRNIPGGKNITKCLKLNRPQLKSLSIVLRTRFSTSWSIES